MIPTKRTDWLNAWRSTYWRDELGELIARKYVGQCITDDDVNGAVIFANNCVVGTDYIIINVQLNHDRKLDTELRPHLHWLQESAANRNWILSYRWLKNGSIIPVTWNNLALDTPIFTYVSGTLLQISKCDAIVAPEGNDVSDIIQFRLSRDTGNVTTLFDTVDNIDSIKALMFDIHILVNEGGSKQEYVK